MQVEKRDAGIHYHEQRARTVKRARTTMSIATYALLLVLLVAEALLVLDESSMRGNHDVFPSRPHHPHRRGSFRGSLGGACWHAPVCPSPTFFMPTSAAPFRNRNLSHPERYGLVGKPHSLVRLPEGIAPIEVKSCRAPTSGRPYEGHIFQFAAYCLLVEDVFGVPVQHGLVNYEDRSIQVDFTPSLRTSLLALLDEMHAAKQRRGTSHRPRSAGKCRSCGFRTVCGENLV